MIVIDSKLDVDLKDCLDSDISFIKLLKECHKTACTGNYSGTSNQQVSPGELRNKENDNLKQSSSYAKGIDRYIRRVAKAYDDDYQYSDKNGVIHIGNNIGGRYVEDIFLHGSSGIVEPLLKVSRRILRASETNSEDSKNQLYEIYQQLDIEPPTENIDAKLEYIADAFKIFSTARPFNTVNNSLISTLINSQLKAIGYNAIPHFYMDCVALRMDILTFRRYFSDIVHNYGIDLSSAERMEESIANGIKYYNTIFKD